jgi:vitamin K-dependent gamma-carboxylase
VTRIERLLLRREDGAWLAAFRILLGLALAVSMERFLAYGWVDTLLVRPRFRFHYWGFGWVEPLSRGAMHALFAALVVLALAIAAGLAFRVTSVLFALGLTYVQLLDVSTYLNHYYLAALLAWLLAVSPAHRVASIDRWLAKRRGRAIDDRVAVAWHVLFRVQVGVVYVFAALAKAQPDWLLHAQPLRMWLGASTSLPVIGPLFTLPGVPLAMSWAGFLFDLTIVGWLSWRRTRGPAYVVVLVFHAFTRALFDIGMFPVIMSIAALVFFPSSWPRVLLRRRAPESVPTVDACSRAPFARRGALAAGLVWCIVQVAAPLRTHLYGGDVLWHEHGMRFSWRVMVRAKGGAITFVVQNTKTGFVEHVSPRVYLTAFQENEMASQPDLILQLARHIAREYGPDVEVRAETRVSLNGRRGAPLVDPEVDLARVDDGVWLATWVLPAPSEAPPHTRPVL